MAEEDEVRVVTVNATVTPPCRRWRPPLELDAVTLVIVMAVLATLRLVARVVMKAFCTELN